MTDANETNQGPHVDTKKPEEKVVWPEPETLEEAKGALKILQCTVENEASLFAALDIKHEAAKSMLQSQEEGFRARFREQKARITDIEDKYEDVMERELQLRNEKDALDAEFQDNDELIKALKEKVEKNKHTESWQNGRRTLLFKDGTRWVNIDDTGDVPEMFWPQSARDKIEALEKVQVIDGEYISNIKQNAEARIETTQSVSDGHKSAVAVLEEELKASNALNVLLGKSSTISAIECFPTGRRCMTLQDGTMWVELYETDPKSLGQGISAIIESTESSIFHELRKRGIKITTLEEENDTLKTRLVELEQSNKELNEKAETGDLSMKIEKIRATAVRAENMSRALLSVTTVIAGLNQSVKDRLDNLAKAAKK